MRQGVRITTTEGRDAECIGDALVEYGSEVERDRRRWAVTCLALPTSLSC